MHVVVALPLCGMNNNTLNPLSDNIFAWASLAVITNYLSLFASTSYIVNDFLFLKPFSSSQQVIILFTAALVILLITACDCYQLQRAFDGRKQCFYFKRAINVYKCVLQRDYTLRERGEK